MAEERTVSTFTWMTLVLCASLSVGQMAAKTIVRQHYTTQKKAREFILKSVKHIYLKKAWNIYLLSSLKARKNSKSRPTVKFCNVKSRIFRTSSTANSPKAPWNDDDDSWLDESPESHPLARSLTAESNDFCPVNLRSSLLVTFLLDEKPKAENDRGPVLKQKPLLASGNGHSHGPDDNDFPCCSTSVWMGWRWVVDREQTDILTL